MKKEVIGIAGYIGSGKSLAGEYFQKLGATFIDADEVVDALYQKDKPGYLKIVNYFGKEYLTKKGLINRKKLAKFVFGDPNKLKILNFLIHPMVTNEIQKLIDHALTPVVAVEATYFESKHLGRLVDKVLWVECTRETLQKRAMKKDGMTDALFMKILKLQPKPEKIDYIVHNDGSKTELEKQLKSLWNSALQ